MQPGLKPGFLNGTQMIVPAEPIGGLTLEERIEGSYMYVSIDTGWISVLLIN